MTQIQEQDADHCLTQAQKPSVLAQLSQGRMAVAGSDFPSLVVGGQPCVFISGKERDGSSCVSLWRIWKTAVNLRIDYDAFLHTAADDALLGEIQRVLIGDSQMARRSKSKVFKAWIQVRGSAEHIFIDGDRFQMIQGPNPCTIAALCTCSAGAKRIRINQNIVRAMVQAHVAVEHHLDTICVFVRAYINTLPLVLLVIAANHLLRGPTFQYDGEEVVIVEPEAAFRRNPATVVATTVKRGLADGVGAHQGSSLGPSQSHLGYHCILDCITTPLSIWHDPNRTVALWVGDSTVFEPCSEIQSLVTRFIVQHILPRDVHDRLCSNHNEICQRDPGAKALVSIQQTNYSLGASKTITKTCIVTIWKVQATIGASIYSTVVHEVVRG
mmetsp:Transcript_110606/g.202727  ORF Transcript_110606/g.202727 Transcript_110606/m.202727 type:complete len:384 (-) Transcript_110606:456-1607(-)